jgi:cytochrome bd-type quinol oxidase subunit 2
MPDDKSAHRESTFAWAATAITCLYCAWLAVALWRHAGAFGEIFRAMGYQLPKGIRFAVERVWIYPLLFGILALLVVAKERMVRDKRLSVILSFLAMMLGHWAADAVTSLYLRPLLEIMRKLQ